MLRIVPPFRVHSLRSYLYALKRFKFLFINLPKLVTSLFLENVPKNGKNKRNSSKVICTPLGRLLSVFVSHFLFVFSISV